MDNSTAESVLDCEGGVDCDPMAVEGPSTKEPLRMGLAMGLLAVVLMVVETYNCVTRFCLLLRVRLPARKDLIYMRQYFAFECLSVLLSSFVITGRIQWLAGLHAILDVFFFLTWAVDAYTSKIIEWSCSEWSCKYLQWDIITLMLFGMAVHGLNAIYICQYLAYG